MQGDEFVAIRLHMNDCSDVFPVELISNALSGNWHESPMPPLALDHWRVVGPFPSITVLLSV
jgi:hypothetical protein